MFSMSRVGVNSVELACRGSVASASNAAKRLQRLRACFLGAVLPRRGGGGVRNGAAALHQPLQ